MALTVAVLAGGRSSEHDVSLASAQAVREELQNSGHRVRSVLISREGAWTHEGRPLDLHPGAGLLDAEVVFPVLHGPFGEDGTVQGLLETLDVAYVGSGVGASAVCMNKVTFKELLSAKGIPQVDYLGLRSARWREEPASVLSEIAELGLPVFVKPAHLGSSLGIVKVSQSEQVEGALDGAFLHDELVIVETMALGIELECAVLGLTEDERGQRADGVFVSAPGQILFPGEFYDFHAKYTPGAMELVVPAPISPGARERVRELASEVFSHTGCEGLARVDFFLSAKRALVNELNTMPGFTPTSVYAKLIAAGDIAYPQLLDRLCRLALERHSRRRALIY
jgi:D-alanine-D-alanine ligase